jgi:hypothetical protein
VRRRLDSEGPTARRVVLGIPLLEQVPVISLDLADLRSGPLDPRAAFLISRIDGESTVGTLLDVCGMPEREALTILDDLVELGIIVLR